ncbi:MAG: hypothetical protein HRU08_10200 [Oleispira sp.]|nr:hypothetical protein [Oleispira sp.]
MTKNQFRALTISSILLACLSGFYDYFWPDALIEQVMDYAYDIEPDYMEENELIFFTIMAVIVVLGIASLIGVLMFKNWGRYLYIAGFILMFPLYPFFGIAVYSGYGQAFYDLSMLLSGAIIALMYYSPVAKYFES